MNSVVYFQAALLITTLQIAYVCMSVAKVSIIFNKP